MTGWTTGICKTNGIDVHYLRTGGDKLPVVLLHGLMLNGACWTPLARALENDYDVIMPDVGAMGIPALRTMATAMTTSPLMSLALSTRLNSIHRCYLAILCGA